MREYQAPSYLDLLGLTASGLLIGYERQIMADSGEVLPTKIVTSLLIASGAYLLAFLLRGRWIRKLKVSDWVFRALFGSALCALGLNVVYFVVANHRYANGRSFSEYLWWVLPDRGISFVGAFVIYALISLTVVAAIHLIARGLIAIRGV